MPGLEKILNFDNPANFSFVASKIEVTTDAHLLQNPNLTFAALWGTTGQLDADVSDGDPTATPSGAGTLVWNGADFRGVGVGNNIGYLSASTTTVANQGTVRVKFAPDYNGSPTTDVELITLAESIVLVNNSNILLLHLSTGGIFVRMRDAAGVQIFQQDFGSFVAVQNQSVEVEFSWDLVAGTNRAFVAGVLLGAIETTTGTRGTGIFVGVGAQTQSADHVLEEFAVFDTVKHAAGYVPVALDLTDPDLVFGARYRTSLFDADIGSGLTATVVGIVRVIHGLDLEDISRSVVFDATLNFATAVQKGTRSFKVTPNYTGSPANGQTLYIERKSLGDVKNQISIIHNAAGQLGVIMLDKFGAAITNTLLGNPGFVAGVEVSIELDFDIDVGDIRLFVDRSLFGSLISGATGTRQGNNSFVGVGAIAGGKPDVFMRDFAAYDTVQHIADFTDEAILVSTDDPPIKLGASTDIDSFNGISAVLAAVAPDQIRTIQEINGQNKWFDGAAWVDSDGSLSQSNTFADADANADSLAVSQGVRYRPVALLHSDDGVSTPTLASLTFSFDFFSFEADASDLRTAVVFGFVKNTFGDPVAGVKVIIEHEGFFHGDHLVQKETRFVLSDADGFFEVAVVETQSINLSPYTFIVDEVQRDNVQVPDQISVSLGTFVVNP